ncbi:hypothetical protein D3Z60_20945 [Lachnospiraceae bacterium]|jgi:hypothetical protein|nr:hypothetical protein [uncultured Acetatifactor sp.]NBH28177.1 hypothetical protein [Lachnospiraceae bacterium]
MAGNSSGKGKKRAAELTFTVAECGEFHNLGEYHEGIRTLEEAVSLYRNIPPGRMNGIPSIGMKLHREGEPESEDIELDIFSGGEVNAWLVRYVPEADRNPLVWEAVRKLEGMFPGKASAG